MEAANTPLLSDEERPTTHGDEQDVHDGQTNDKIFIDGVTMDELGGIICGSYTRSTVFDDCYIKDTSNEIMVVKADKDKLPEVDGVEKEALAIGH